MSQGAKKTGRRKRPGSRGVPKRHLETRPEKKTILIVGEGKETEPNYFHGLKQANRVSRRFAVTVKKGPGFSQEKILEETIKHKDLAEQREEEYDEVWTVLDVEGPEKRESLEGAALLERRLFQVVVIRFHVTSQCRCGVYP